MSDALELEPRSAGSGDTGPPMSGDIGSSQSALLEAIARGTQLVELLHGIVHLVEQHAEGVLCSLLVYEPASGTLRHAAARRLSRELCALVDGAQVGPSSSACALAAYRREPVLVTDITTHPAWAAHRDPFLAHGVRASWSSPILSHRGTLLGALGTYFAEPRGPTEGERGWLDAAVHLASIALARAQSEQEREQLARAVDARTREHNLLHESVR